MEPKEEQERKHCTCEWRCERRYCERGEGEDAQRQEAACEEDEADEYLDDTNYDECPLA